MSSPADPKLAASPDRRGEAPFRYSRLVPLVILVLLAGFVYLMGWHRELSLPMLMKHREMLSGLVAQHAVSALVTYVATYVTAVALSIPVGILLTVAGGILFGWLVGGLAAIIAATLGATIVFLVARSAIGEFILRRAGPRARKVAAGFRANAFFYLLFLRLVPVFPFFLVNLAPALAGIGLGTFVSATALGIVPASFVYSALGAGFDSVIAAHDAAFHACQAAAHADCRIDLDPTELLTPPVLAAFVGLGLLALMPVALRRIWQQHMGL